MMNARLSALLVLIALCFSTLLPAQNVPQPYNPSNRTNAILLGLGTTLTATSVYLDRKIPKLTEADVTALDYARIPGIDRYSTRHFSLKTDEWTDKLLMTSFASPFFLLLNENGRQNFDQAALVVFEGALLNAAMINLTKVVVRRPRPFNYNRNVPGDLKLSKNSRFSFYSGHVATTAFFSMTTAQLYSDLNPNSKARPYVWAAAGIIPAAVAYGRMRAGKHFFTDVLIGFVTGTAVALTVPALHRAGGE
ncbi:phosphatase PAP2 family protein [Lewinella sp. 4G2]|uniref:phosphatase PAP2 family protein n=1 Tax=Lewinella sp. 4G2 TaxID=1803372 RepID=UPI0007B4CD33|nr:phosphatase PAP2 family protein [Lewinella sp. 4G2]OAV46206.1 hypothetical protein A3850_018285 [Lewinella sp. 4G2]